MVSNVSFALLRYRKETTDENGVRKPVPPHQLDFLQLLNAPPPSRLPRIRLSLRSRHSISLLFQAPEKIRHFERQMETSIALNALSAAQSSRLPGKKGR